MPPALPAQAGTDADLGASAAQPAESTIQDTDQPDPTPTNPEDLPIALAKLQERYRASSGEGKRLHSELTKAQQQIEELQKEVRSRSLTTPNPTAQPQGLPPLPQEDVIVKYKMEEVGMDEKAARHAAKVELGLLGQLRAQEVHLRAMQNRIDYQSEQSNRIAVESNPVFKEAENFFQDIPEMAGLSPAEKVERYRAIQAKTQPRIQGRDTSALKGQAGSPAGVGAPGAVATMDGEMEAYAKTHGYRSYKQMEDLANCKTQADHKAYRTKYNLK